MPVAPTGMISLPLDYLRLTLADATAFRTWVGAANQAAALAKIYPIQKASYTSADLPLAVVDWAENFRRVKNAGGSRNWFEQEGDLSVIFRGAVNPAHDDADAAYTFLNSLGAILSEVETLAGKPGYLNITAISLQDGPSRPNEDEAKELGDFYQAVYRVEFMGS